VRVSDKGKRTIRVKWVRSGIGFSHHQKRIVRSLGLKKLNQEVERPDTPQIRGMVAKVPHLVKIVEAAPIAAWTLLPEYTVYPPEAAPAKPAETPVEAAADETEKTEAPVSPPLAPFPTQGGESGVGATGDLLAVGAISANEEQPVEAEGAAETAAETSGDLAATRVSGTADLSGEESARPGEEASPQEGKLKA
jgi:large subunit ribosomal protein L30